MKLNCIAYADIQIEIRVSGINAQRLDEYLFVLQKMESIVKEQKPDIVFIPGDIYEFCDANGDETKMFSKHLHAILPYTKRIIIINGNHDIKQKSNGIVYLDVKQNAADHIDSVVTAINNPKISYYKHTGVYKDTEFPLSYAVWSQLDKWSAKDPKPAYSPWVNHNEPIGSYIELFHDPIQGAKDFSGQPSEHFTNYGISLSDFRANTIISGDIHNPDIIWFGENNERLFTYSSSLVQRNSGEGDYWSNLTKIQSGNAKHGYNTIIFDTDLNLATSCEFHRIHNPISRHTIRLTEAFNYETMIQSLQIDATEFNKIRVICHAKLQEFIKHEQEIIEHFRSKYACSISTDWASDVIDVQVDESEFTDLDQIIDKDKILDISKKYISTIVDKTSTINKEDKQASKDMIFEIFETELMSAELTSSKTTIQLLDANVSNFMSFANDVEIKFKNHDITVISGVNGGGKTTIFHFLKWIWSDKISDFQNDRNKKLNYSLYFNDTCEDDVVLGQLRFNKNGNDIYTVKKTLTREWKKGTKDIFDKNWIDNLKGVPTIGMSITSNDFNSTDTNECLEHLKSIITYKELVRLVFVNGLSLSTLINTTPEDLSSEFLTILGLDFLNTILATFDSVKDEKLDKLSKPASTIEDVLKSIENIVTAQEQSDETINTLKQQKLQLEIEQKTFDQNLNEKRTKLHQVGTTDEINANIKILQDENDSKQLEIDNHDNEIKTFKEQKTLHSIESITKDIHTKELEKQSAQTAVDNHILKVENDKNHIELLKNAVKNVATEIRGKINEEIIQLGVNKSAKEKTLGEKEESKRQNLKTYQDNVQESINKINKGIDDKESLKKQKTDERSANLVLINTCKTTIATNTLLNKNANDKIELSRKSKNCSECGTIKSKEIVATIECSIETIEKEISSRQEILDENLKNQLLYEAVDLSISGELVVIEKSIETYKTLRDTYTQKLNTIDAEKFPELVKSNADLDIEISKLKLSIDDIELSIKSKTDSIISSIMSDKLYLNAKRLVTVAEEALLAYELTKTSKDELIISITNEIEVLTTLKASISEIDNKIAETQQLIQNIKAAMFESVTEISKLQKDINLAELNVEMKKTIDFLELERSEHNTILEECKKTLEKANLEATRYEDKIVKLNEEIEEIKQYKLVESSLKLYKKLLGKTGLPQYIFAHLVPLINKKLNDTLENVDFRLLFDQETLELRFIDLKKNVSRCISFVSGMQETLTGLALINIFRILNNSKSFNVLMIDEISGKLNDSKELSYEAKDYKKITTEFIHKLAQNTNVYIIDHALDFAGARRLEIQPTENGTILTELN